MHLLKRKKHQQINKKNLFWLLYAGSVRLMQSVVLSCLHLMSKQPCAACPGREGSLEEKTTCSQNWVFGTLLPVSGSEVILSVAEVAGGTRRDSGSWALPTWSPWVALVGQHPRNEPMCLSRAAQVLQHLFHL